MRVSYGWTAAALVAVSAVGAPVVAQQRPTCDSCAPAARAASRDARDALERARRALDDATSVFAQRRMALFDNDTSAAALEALREAERNVEAAQRTYGLRVMEAMHAYGQARAEETRNTMRRARALQQQANQRMREEANQSGWLGITLSAPGQPGAPRGLPVIVAVDPGSPADRAGLEAGDVLVTIDGRSLRKGTASVDRMLRPGTRIPVRIQRAGDTKTVNVVVGHRPLFYAFRFSPDSFEVHVPDFDMTPMPAMPAMPSTPTAPAIVMSPSMPPVPGVAPAAPLSSYYFNGVATIAGAQLWDVDQLKSYFHVDDGLLVLRVLPGTPADRAGLRSGDVIVRADGRAMSSIRSLERTLERVDERSADDSTVHTAQLDIVRNGKRAAVALKW